MKLRITDEDMETVISELQAHKDLPVGHSDCEYCDWITEFTSTDSGQAMAEQCTTSVEYLDRLYFLLAGVKIGRKQGMEDFIKDMEFPLEEQMYPPDEEEGETK